MKQRLDILLCELGLAQSREGAKRTIMAGVVYVNGQKSDKAGEQVDEGANIEVRAPKERYVSRGGQKLERAIEEFLIPLAGLTCMDIGASTGGFTDCMLQNGAKKVYAVDVGYGQLAVKLRDDSRVINLERTNIRHITGEQVSEAIDFISIDTSFISLTLVLPVAFGLLHGSASAVALIKPQFEAGRGKVLKKGVVKDKAVHLDVIKKVWECAESLGFCVSGLSFSPVKGPQGNIEYLIYLKKGLLPEGYAQDRARAVVEASHETLQ